LAKVLPDLGEERAKKKGKKNFRVPIKLSQSVVVATCWGEERGGGSSRSLLEPPIKGGEKWGRVEG